MNETVSSFTESPCEITQRLKRLSNTAEALGTITAYFFSGPVDPRDYRAPEWMVPLSFEFLVEDEKVVLCKLLDLDFFVNLFFMRQEDSALSNTFLFFVMGDKESDCQTGRSLAKVINKDLDRRAKQKSLLVDLHRAVYLECQDPSLCIFSIEIEKDKPSDKSFTVTVSSGKQTPEPLIQTLQG